MLHEREGESALRADERPAPPQLDQTIAFAWQSHTHLGEIIRNCDVKASLVLPWTTALIGGLFTIEFHHFVVGTHKNLAVQGMVEFSVRFGAFISLVLLAIAFLCATLAIAPRYKSPMWGQTKPGYLFWKAILAHGSEEQFFKSLTEATSSKLLEHLSEHLFRISRIADVKHARTTASLWLAASGSAIAGVTSLAA